MARNKMPDLRDHLFAQLERLEDEDCDLDKEVQRAEAVSKIATSLINSAKVEMQYLRMTGGSASSFIETTEQKQLSNG